MDKIFKTRNIQGLIIASLTGPNLSIDWKNFPWQDYVTVRFGLSTAYPEVYQITSAQTRNSLMAFKEIQNRGYQRIGFFGHNSQTRFFSAGFAYAQFYEAEQRRVPAFLYGKMDTEYLYIESIKNWLNKYTPDAIYTDSPHLPPILQDLGYRIPEDIGLATTSIHDTPIDAGIDQNAEEIGRAAARTLVALLNEQNFGIPKFKNEILIEGKWVDGSMLPPKR
jgi:DNA-binding LacI/PurR family transcriptional regulator